MSTPEVRMQLAEFKETIAEDLGQDCAHMLDLQKWWVSIFHCHETVFSSLIKQCSLRVLKIVLSFEA